MQTTQIGKENQHGPALPDVQLLCGLHKTGLIRLLQHLLRVTHQPAVLQHALVLLHLQEDIWKEIFQPAQTLNEDTRVSFLGSVPVRTDLSPELLHASVPRLLDGPQHLRFPLLQSFKQALKVLGGTALGGLAVFLQGDDAFMHIYASSVFHFWSSIQTGSS